MASAEELTTNDEKSNSNQVKPVEVKTEPDTEDKMDIEDTEDAKTSTEDKEKIKTTTEDQESSKESPKDDKPNNTDKKDQETEKKDPKKETELEKYWRPVKENPGDFTGWTYLLQYVEQEIVSQDGIETAREAYDAFLAKYPYCYGYWKKHADMQKRHNDLAAAVQVFEKGVKAIPLSSELWLHYINFYIKEFILEEETRKLYERAIGAAGMDFRSDKLWDSFISWEKERNLRKVTELYDKLLKIPTQLYSHHFDNFKKHVLGHHPKEILSLDEFIKLRTEVVKESQVSTPMSLDDLDGPPGDELPPGVECTGGKGDAEEAMKVRDKVVKLREEAYKKNELEVSRRWAFEEGIKRPYFHVKPLERIQLKNWRDYLDFEMHIGTHERVVVLFERCMIAAALYEDFWLKYAKYLEENVVTSKAAVPPGDDAQEKIKAIEEEGFAAVRNVYKRACTAHLPKKPYIHMAWAAFEERQGKHGEAWKILTNLEEQVPGMVMVAMRRISLERRIGDKEKTEVLFQEYVDKATDMNVKAFYVIKYARYLYKVLGDELKAKKVITDALEKDPKNEKLYIQLLDMEYQKHPVDVESTLKIFARAVGNDDLSVHTKIKMSQRRLEFLEDFGSSILQLKECYDEHQKLLKELHTETKKRKQPDTPVVEEQPPDPKKSKSNGATEQPAVDYSAYWAQYQNSGAYNYSGWGNYNTGQYYNS